ncbi:MAG: S-methyl-5-thioribose-1-phosphate isomerase [Chitinivibrionales bacterium]|nr:S-methyl-5-thioribose-1-phosphate isomerase [Chitinivibrionales bacterium]
MAPLTTIEWKNNCVRIIDQTKLPQERLYEDIATTEAMYDAIKILKVRGAPAIGIAAAFGLYLGIREVPDTTVVSVFLKILKKKAAYLAASRPTAVNLFWALERMQAVAGKETKGHTTFQLKNILLQEAIKIAREDAEICRKIGINGFKLIKDFGTILTHCNAGSLATGGMGTALAPIYIGAEKGKKFKVFADETRPLLQGSRITAFELMAAGIDVTVICDNMAAVVMAKKGVHAVITGADRIAANGDTANKVGTYGLSILARAHEIPFFIAAPFSTFDLSIKSGAQIPIEERRAEEITCGFGKTTAPKNVKTFNPAFDVTPHANITAIITERGILYPPFVKSIKKMMQ